MAPVSKTALLSAASAVLLLLQLPPSTPTTTFGIRRRRSMMTSAFSTSVVRPPPARASSFTSPPGRGDEIRRHRRGGRSHCVSESLPRHGRRLVGISTMASSGNDDDDDDGEVDGDFFGDLGGGAVTRKKTHEEMEKEIPSPPSRRAKGDARGKDDDDDDETPMTIEELEMLATPFDEHLPQINSVTLVGRVGNDPEPRYFDDGKVVLNLSLAVRRKYHPLERKVREIRSGEEETDWFPLEFWGRDAEYVTNFVEKGTRLGITGSLVMDGWTDKATGEQRRRPKILVRQIDILESRAEAELRRGNGGGGGGGGYDSNRRGGGGEKKWYRGGGGDDDDDDGGPSPAGTGGFFS
ncbi:hypothetical protein ACHAW5_002475 [Stephanodiscus triporus]|uniref:Single-stranded DNA-binding protein n=1 Tax=Stephanodiscus triporus TaxID=2934178 RepID=A0ABD3QLH6_9STRA